jgi:hypothetical protein
MRKSAFSKRERERENALLMGRQYVKTSSMSFSAHHLTKRAACRYERPASRSRLHGLKWTVLRGRYVGLNGERGADATLLQSPPTAVLSKSQAHSKSSDLSRHSGQNGGRSSPSSFR